MDRDDKKAVGRRAYGMGIVIAALTSFLTVWTTIVRDDGTGAGYLMLILAAMVGAFSACFRPPGMARAMAGTAIMQLLLGGLVATAPSTLDAPKGLLFAAAFATLWLVSAAFFRKAAHADGAMAS